MILTMFISDAISIMILLSVNTTEAGNNSRSGNAQSSYKINTTITGRVITKLRIQSL
jgi:hypothetical protein